MVLSDLRIKRAKGKNDRKKNMKNLKHFTIKEDDNIENCGCKIQCLIGTNHAGGKSYRVITGGIDMIFCA